MPKHAPIQYVAVWLDGKPRKDSEVYGPFDSEQAAWDYLDSRKDIQESYSDTGVFPIQAPLPQRRRG